MNNHLLSRQRSGAVRYRAGTLSSQLVEVLYECYGGHFRPPTLTQIAGWLSDRYGWLYDFRFTAKRVGWLLRKELGLRTRRASHGCVLAIEDGPKLVRLYRVYGLDPSIPLADRSDALRRLKQWPIV